MHNLNFDSLNYHLNKDIYKEVKEQEVPITSIDFSGISKKLKSDYLDVYDGVYAEVISTNRFDEDTDLSTAYLGQVNVSRKTEVKAEESFAMNAAGHTRGELLDGTECEILIDTGVCILYMSKSYYMQCKSLHVMPKFTSTDPKEGVNIKVTGPLGVENTYKNGIIAMPKFTSTTRRIQVGNGQYVGVLFVIPVIITIQKHRFEVFMLVSEIHENVDLVLGIKKPI